MSKQILIESVTPKVANMISEAKGNNMYLKGIFAEGDIKNGNGRNYPVDELQKAVKQVKEDLAKGISILGELNHPNDLNINLERASHMITEMYLEGSKVIGKAKILNTPMGNIAKTLITDGVKLGVSTRGAGEVYEGKVRNFTFVTVDIVANPSAPNAYPNVIRESIENNKILSLAEACVHDDKAQNYLKEEMRKFLSSILGKV